MNEIDNSASNRTEHQNHQYVDQQTPYQPPYQAPYQPPYQPPYQTSYQPHMSGEVICPKCGGVCRKKYQVWQIVISIIFFPLGLLSLAAGKESKCTKCGSWL